ncbi:SusC/RagA family TonB-linked outer membrane protein [Sphingobacteruim zhuxiongii]|nr:MULTISPECIES: SusC/RagA family TonB-linked outer membrane protein [unclassified Sphingobacterium]
MIFIQQNDGTSAYAIPKIKPWVLYMKLTIFLTILCVFKLSANGFAQHVSLKAVNSPLIEVMRKVQKQSGTPFLLQGKDLANTKISADLKQVELQQALALILADKPISWEISEGTIILRTDTKRKINKAQTTESKALYMQQSISGKVVDEQGQAISGASVTVKGTAVGTKSDEQGNFTLEAVQANAVIVVSSIGYLRQEISLAGRSTIQVKLIEEQSDLDEVIVIGYGTQKKKLNTGATIQVKGEDLTKLSTPSVMEALQSQSPGVQITQSSGMPGENYKVTIRGLGTIHNSNPLYVIDGIPGGDINNLNPADIESIDVLKDAASAAIYGSRAANGIILVTTKQGKAGKMSVYLDSYLGMQQVQKLPSVLTAKEYMTIQNERRFNEGSAPYDWATIIPKQYQQIQDGTWNGTNWIKEAYNENATLFNTAVSLLGGTESSKFSFGYANSHREGILGNPLPPDFKRHNVRLNSDHVILKNDEFDIIKFGENITYTFNKKRGQGIGDIYWNDVHNLIVGNPLLPLYNEAGGYYDQPSKVADAWALDGAIANPIAEMFYRRSQNESNNHALNLNAYLEVQPIKNLKWRSNFGYRMSTYNYRQYTPTYRLSTTLENVYDDISQNQGLGYSWVIENTLNYRLVLNDAHDFDFLIGQSMEKSGMGSDLSATHTNSSFPDSWDHAWISNAQGYEGFVPALSGLGWNQGAMASFFGRAIYNYKERYMASLSLRADGSSNFASGERWSYYPSVSLGWLVTGEEFMQDSKAWLDFFKIRASWGQNGNQSIPNFNYLSTIAIDNQNGYYFGNNKNSLIKGAYPDLLANPIVTWETSEQLNVGFDARFINDRLAVVFDWYNKKTIDWLVQAPIPKIFGTGAPYINGGEVQNRGVELGLNWTEKSDQFRYSIGLNAAYNKNKVLKIDNDEGIIFGQRDVLSQSTTDMYRAQVGFPMGYFYGYQTNGVFQTQEQINDLRANGVGVLATAQPGDLYFVDNNKDGAITDADKVMIGNPHPDFTAGFNISVGYKGFDLAANTFGAFGQQVAKSYRSFADSPLQNYTTEIFGRWHGEGTSNKIPRLTSGSHTNNQYISDLYIEDADFLKIQNITIGYDFAKLFPKIPFSQTRLYFTVQNLYTFTNYSGMDPEVGYGAADPWASGIDLGFYPQPRTYMFGVNIKF